MEETLLIEKVATYCYCNGILNTTEGNYVIEFEDIEKYFELDRGTIKALQEEIADTIGRYDAVSDIAIENGSFDINYYTMYCPQIDEEDE